MLGAQIGSEKGRIVGIKTALGLVLIRCSPGSCLWWTSGWAGTGEQQDTMPWLPTARKTSPWFSASSWGCWDGSKQHPRLVFSTLKVILSLPSPPKWEVHRHTEEAEHLLSGRGEAHGDHWEQGWCLAGKEIFLVNTWCLGNLSLIFCL